jgi:menaquinone-dependent protoporphyrinogen oxidase
MKILVTSASKHGSTEGIGAFIAGRLRERGLDADAIPLDEVDGLLGYDAVVLGSAVYIGSWMKEAKAFVKTKREHLASMPVWLFSSGPTDPEGDPEGEHGLSDEARAELEDLVHPREHAVFLGAIDLDRLGFIEKRMVKAVKAPVGDFRDWELIGAFADRIADALSREPATAG